MEGDVSSLKEQLADPAQRDAEIARLTAEMDEASKDGRWLDYQSMKGAREIYTDARDGIDRCLSCGRIKRARRS